MTTSTLRHTLERAREFTEAVDCGCKPRKAMDWWLPCWRCKTLADLTTTLATLPPEGAAEDPTPHPASSSEIGEVVAEMRNGITHDSWRLVSARHVPWTQVVEWADRLAAIAQRQSPHAPTRDSLAYFETHEPPHCPTCDCGTPPPAPECEGGKAVAWYSDPENGDIYELLVDRGDGMRFMRRYANDDRDWVTAEEFANLQPLRPTPPTDPVRREAGKD